MPSYIEMSRMVKDYIRKNKITGKMPGIISLSKQLGVNRVTLARAYHLLEKQGVVTINGSKGTFVNSKQIKAPRFHTLAVVGLNVDSRDAQERRMAQMNDIAKKQHFYVINLGLSFQQLKENRNIFGNFPVDGYLFHNSRLTLEHVDFLRRAGIPFVNTGRLTGAELRDLIDHDHRSGYPIALRHLRKLGHRRIAYVEYAMREEITHYTNTVRSAYIAELGDLFDPGLFYVRKTRAELGTSYGEYAHRFYMQEALQHLFSLNEPPTAIITVGGLMMPCFELLQNAGLNVPEDISLIGVEGDMPNKTLTTLFYNTDEILVRGISRLLQIIAGTDKKPYEFLQKPQLVSPQFSTAVMKKTTK
jgi:DNA-binding LacI/PurR family transcriptional regulator